MDTEEAVRIYQYPRGRSREELVECLEVLNAQPRRLTLVQQAALEDARYRRDILEGVIEAEGRVLPDKLLGSGG